MSTSNERMVQQLGREVSVDPTGLAVDEAARSSPVSSVSPSVLDLLSWIGQGKRFIAAITLAGCASSLGLAFLLPEMYTARASMLPPSGQNTSGSAAALAALGGALGGLAGGGLGGKTPDELYVGLLRSDSVQRALDERLNLRAHFNVTSFEQLRAVLPKAVQVTADRKSGVITVEVEDRDPAFAATLANAYQEELAVVLSRLAVSDAQQRRLFFDGQLKKTKEQLVQAEDRLRKLQESSGVIVFDKQAEALLQGAAGLRTQIAEREVQMRVLRATATAQNPDVQRLATELAAMRAELSRLEAPGSGRPTPNATDLPVANLPQAAIDYLRARRDVKLQEAMLEGLLRQYEGARLDEAKEGPVLQVVDRAMPPDRRSKPSRAMVVIGGTGVTLFLAVIFVVLRGYGSWALRHASNERTEAMARLRQAWALRRS